MITQIEPNLYVIYGKGLDSNIYSFISHDEMLLVDTGTGKNVHPKYIQKIFGGNL